MRPRRRPFAAAMPRRCWGCSGRGTKLGSRWRQTPRTKGPLSRARGLFVPGGRPANHGGQQRWRRHGRKRGNAAPPPQRPSGPFARAPWAGSKTREAHFREEEMLVRLIRYRYWPPMVKAGDSPFEFAACRFGSFQFSRCVRRCASPGRGPHRSSRRLFSQGVADFAGRQC